MPRRQDGREVSEGVELRSEVAGELGLGLAKSGRAHKSPGSCWETRMGLTWFNKEPQVLKLKTRMGSKRPVSSPKLPRNCCAGEMGEFRDVRAWNPSGEMSESRFRCGSRTAQTHGARKPDRENAIIRGQSECPSLSCHQPLQQQAFGYFAAWHRICSLGRRLAAHMAVAGQIELFECLQPLFHDCHVNVANCFLDHGLAQLLWQEHQQTSRSSL